ncbi:MAG: FAD-binding oxidoreductase [Proteobacteria bacterium]|nr:FAD-binding oxidoreductase [Pseudomonadota bacterium]
MKQATGKSIAIIGGGVIGLSTAFHLARRGAQVTVIDRAAPASGCCNARPTSSTPPSVPYGPSTSRASSAPGPNASPKTRYWTRPPRCNRTPLSPPKGSYANRG